MKGVRKADGVLRAPFFSESNPANFTDLSDFVNSAIKEYLTTN
jgi:hypothetical protein